MKKQQRVETPDIWECVDDWDFRGLRKDELHIAIFYEYARSAEWVRKEFDDWHQSPINLPSDSEFFTEWSERKTVEAIQADPVKSVPAEVFGHIWSTLPSRLEEWPFSELLNISVFFPRPYKKITVSNPSEFIYLQEPWRRDEPAVKKLRDLPPWSARQMKMAAHGGVHYLPIKLDLRMGITKLRADFEKLVETLSKKSPNVKPKPRGPYDPVARLKDLAAFRLSKTKTGWSASRIKRELIEYRKDNRRDFSDAEVSADVLPIYENSGTWFNAVKQAAKAIEKLFPGPTKGR